MKILIGLLKSTRWPMGLLSSFLTIVSFRLVGLSFYDAFWPALNVFEICCATMVINDLVDRNRDALQGKTFAKDNYRIFLVYTVLWWVVVIWQAIGLRSISLNYMILSLIMCAMGIGYSWLRKIPYVPMLTVAITSALAACYRISVGDFSRIIFTFIVFFNLLARETIKDILDIKVDLDLRFGKMTLPIMWGTQSAMTFVRVCLVITGILLLAMMKSDLTTAVVIGISLAAYQLSPKNIKQARNILDISMALFLLGKSTISTMYCAILTKPEKNEEYIEIKVQKSSQTVWTLAYIAFVLTLLVLGLFYQPMIKATIIALGGLIALLLLQFIPTSSDNREEAQYVRVKHMIVGMVIGLGSAALWRIGVPIIITAIFLPLSLIIWNIRSDAVAILKDQSCQLGISIVVAMICGFSSLWMIAVALLIIVTIYYIKAIKVGLKPWLYRYTS